MTKKSINKQLWFLISAAVLFEVIGTIGNSGIAQYFAGMQIGYALFLMRYKSKLIEE